MSLPHVSRQMRRRRMEYLDQAERTRVRSRWSKLSTEQYFRWIKWIEILIAGVDWIGSVSSQGGFFSCAVNFLCKLNYI